MELSRAVGRFTDTASWKDRVSLTDRFRSAAYDGDMEIEIAALGDGRYEVITPRETDGAVTLATEEALKDLLRMRGMSDTQIATIVDELQPAPRKIRVVVNPSGSPG